MPDDPSASPLPLRDRLQALRVAHPDLASHIGGPAGLDPGAEPHLGLMTRPVHTLVKRPPVTLPPTASILEAAQTMCRERVSSVLLIEQDHLLGLVTDRDLRNRALAAGLDTALPVVDIATIAPMTVQHLQPAFEALLLMARHQIHHVPVLDGQRLVGVLTATDLTEHNSHSAIYLASEVHKQTSLAGLVSTAARVKALQRHLAAADASAYSTGHLVTAITDAVTARLLQLAEARLGPPPVDYAWVAAGSQARSEQTAKSDQDNGLVLDDRYDAAAHGTYFKALADEVNTGLDACGYVFCPGDMMARNNTWRQPQRRWFAYFHEWTFTPDQTALMLTCVFFDTRLVYGNNVLLDDLRSRVLQQTRDRSLFLAHMVANALKHRPPLTMFGGIAAGRHGELRDAVDLKHHGIVPIVDLARIHALAGGHPEVNTHDRLLAAARSGGLGEQNAQDLRDAFEFLAALRIRHQANQIAMDREPDNMLSLSELGNFERSQLKDAFGVVSAMQSVLGQRYRH
jgi:CBS domain-containing protein